MVVGDHLFVNFRKIPLFEKPQSLFDMHGGDYLLNQLIRKGHAELATTGHLLQSREQKLFADIVEQPGQIGLVSEALVTTAVRQPTGTNCASLGMLPEAGHIAGQQLALRAPLTLPAGPLNNLAGLAAAKTGHRFIDRKSLLQTGKEG